MKGLGILTLVAGIGWVIFALSIDVSVSTGAGGRVNNLGLMADRQVHTIVGGMIALAGLLMLLLGGKGLTSGHAEVFEVDTRTCPLCAETIKNAAIKCKHCGATVEAVPAPLLVNGWVASIPCMAGEAQDQARQAIAELEMPVASMSGTAIGAGPFATKDQAQQAQVLLRDQHATYSEIIYRDSVSDMEATHWCLAIPCKNELDRERATATAEHLMMPSLPASDAFVRIGPFLSKTETGEVLRRFVEKGVHGNIEEIRKP